MMPVGMLPDGSCLCLGWKEKKVGEGKIWRGFKKLWSRMVAQQRELLKGSDSEREEKKGQKGWQDSGGEDKVIGEMGQDMILDCCLGCRSGD
jgi:hypothetical protein